MKFLLLPALAGVLSAARPNIVFILADDLGYGDVQCLNERGKIPTPHMDRVAREGMAFTDAHSSSSVCTPTRYSILTGRYSWRSKLQKGVLGGYGKALIGADRPTVASFLKSQGYTTACIGKWHLGMEIPNPETWDREIPDGPLNLGFDRYFGISASLDMPPYVFIEGNRLAAPLDTEKTLWRDRMGPANSAFEAEQVLPAFTREAVDFVGEQAGGNQPFFLYLALASPHTPVAPTEDWKGKSGVSDYGDFVMQTDATVGAVLEALENGGLADNTLVIVTSDNGFAPAADVNLHESQGHFPSADKRGYKSDLWDGGHHVPFLVRWPGVVRPGARSSALVGLHDLMATCADVLEVELPDGVGGDSVSFLPVLKGKAETTRSTLIHHSVSGKFGIRQGNWKLELCGGSGGWSTPTDEQARKRELPDVQLYDLASDPGETRNLASDNPALVSRMTALLEDQVERGRSTPGPDLENDVPVKVRK